jgi:hypothetical protein
MSEVTEEERAEKLCDGVGVLFHREPHPLKEDCAVCRANLRVIRAAVLAERERAASVDPRGVDCPKCCAASGSPCRSYNITGWRGNEPHDERWRAAIRQADEVSDDKA